MNDVLGVYFERLENEKVVLCCFGGVDCVGYR